MDHPDRAAEITKLRKRQADRTKNKWKTLKQAHSQLLLESPAFVALFTRISIEPQLKLCDITGMKGRYVCPRTRVQFHNADVYTKLREMSMDAALTYAGIRTIGRAFNPFARK